MKKKGPRIQNQLSSIIWADIYILGSTSLLNALYKAQTFYENIVKE